LKFPGSRFRISGFSKLKLEEEKMKKRFFTLIMGLLLVGTQALAVDGDFIVNGKVGIGTATPNNKLSVTGVIESTSGGIKFPDGTTQTTAAAGASGSLPSLRAYLSANQTITGDTWMSIKLNQVQENGAGGFNTGTYTYTIPETGWYSIFLRTTGSGCVYGLTPRIILNGTNNVNGFGDAVGLGHFSATLYLQKTNTLLFQVYHANYDASLSSGAGNTYVQVRKLSN
jgi:hypothetical protein